tara:strand:+ start:51 stop:215 length:165 start_codon:yes stop_codon:yes gene_type:complete
MAHGPAAGAQGAGIQVTAQRKLVLVLWPPIFSSLLGWWPEDQQQVMLDLVSRFK